MGRSIFVGDVHGCADELEELLSQVAYTSADRLVFVGDLIARGPKSRAVLAKVKSTGALCVRGNHEERMLKVRDAVQRGEKGPHLGPAHRKLLGELTDDDFSLIRSFPYYLELPDHDVVVVHAGLAPGIALSNQDPWALTHMRCITEDGTPTDRFGRPPWAQSYVGGPHVVFGHNAQQGLQLYPDATGLDTACVYGGSLTALVVDQSSPVPAPERRKAAVVSVPAHEAYVRIRAKM